MKKELLIAALMALLAIIMVNGAIHPPNARGECQRSGCGHPKSMHAKNGPCEYSDPFIVVGHCAGFER